LNEPPVLLCEWNITHSFGRKNIFVIYSAMVAHLAIDFCCSINLYWAWPGPFHESTNKWRRGHSPVNHQ